MDKRLRGLMLPLLKQSTLERKDYGHPFQMNCNFIYTYIVPMYVDVDAVDPNSIVVFSNRE